MKIYKFTMTYDNKPYTDAVTLPDDHTKMDEEILQMMLEKFKSWKMTLNNPGEITEEPSPPAEDLPIAE